MAVNGEGASLCEGHHGSGPAAPHEEQWQTINWRKHRNIVRNLPRRMFRATA
jgi:hypothetical protein